MVLRSCFALDGVVPKEWQDTVVDADPHGQPRINRINYAMQTLTALRERVRCKEIWIPGAQRPMRRTISPPIFPTNA